MKLNKHRNESNKKPKESSSVEEVVKRGNALQRLKEEKDPVD